MSTNFNKIKSKFMLRAILYTVFGGLVAGVLTAGILLYLYKIDVVSWSAIAYVGVVVLAVAVCSLISFLLFYPTDKRIAKKVDRKYSLDERAQTMVEYRGQESLVLTYQKADTEVNLRVVKVFRPTILSMLTKIVAVAVAVVMLYMGIATTKYVTVVPTYAVDSTKIDALKAVLENVRNDEILKGSVQNAYVETLEALINDLENGGASSEDEEILLAQIYEVLTNKYTVYANSYLLYYAYMADLTDCPYEGIIDIIAECGSLGSSLFSYPTSYEIVKVDYQKVCDDTLYGSLYNTLEEYFLEELYLAFYDNVNDETYTSATAISYFNNSITTLQQVIDDVTAKKQEFYDDETSILEVDEETEEYPDTTATLVLCDTDELGDAFQAFLDSLLNVQTRYNQGRYSTKTALCQAIIGTSVESTTSALYSLFASTYSAYLVQSYTYLIDYYIRYQIANTIGNGIMHSFNYGEVTYEGGDSTADAKEEDTGSTSKGSGDAIYDPNTNTYVEYLTLLNETYQVDIQEFMDTEDLSDELKSYITSYLSELGNTNANN